MTLITEQQTVTGQVVDEKIDIYSLGIVLYEMLIGRAPKTTGTRKCSIKMIWQLLPSIATGANLHMLQLCLKRRELRTQGTKP